MNQLKLARTFLTAVASLCAITACSSEAEPGGGTGGDVGAGASGGTGAAPQGGTGGSAGSGAGGSPVGGTGSGGGGTGGAAAGAGGFTAGTGGSFGGGAGSGGTAGTAGDGGSGGTAGGGGGSGGGQAVGSAGCGKNVTRPDPKVQQSMMVAGLNRYYLIYVPTNYDPSKPLPLVFGIHGLNMNNVWAAHSNDGFKLIEATNNQAILIFPQGQGDHPGTESNWGNINSNWGGPPPNAQPATIAKDLEFFDKLIEDASDKYCVDTKRIFAVGFSQGGFMTNTLGCERASVIRGLAPVAGWGPHGSNPTCSNASAAHAVIQTQGTDDGTVTPMLGQTTRDFWRQRAGCSNTTMPSSFNGCVEYQGCAEGKPVIYCTHGGGHYVPDGVGARAWQFFQSLD
jgi:polyhydroxybutyrate depolymerase